MFAAFDQHVYQVQESNLWKHLTQFFGLNSVIRCLNGVCMSSKYTDSKKQKQKKPV